jgi:ornithine cyclodeaminase
VAEISFTYLNGPDIAALEMADQEILDAVEAGLRAQGRGETVIEPRVHLEPDPAFRGHFNVLRGYVAPLGLAGVKIVGDYIDNYQKGLPSEMALLNLFDPRTGMPLALLDATAITEMRTGGIWRAPTAGCSATSAPGARPIGTCGSSTGSSTWRRSASIPAGPKAARPSPSA